MNTLKHLNGRIQTKAFHVAMHISNKLRDLKGVSHTVEVLGMCAVAVVIIAIVLNMAGVTVKDAGDLVRQRIMDLFNYS